MPFFISALLILVGLYTHRVVEESPVFAEESETERAVSKTPLRELFTRHWTQLLIAVGARFGSDATFYVFGMFTLVYVTEFLHAPRDVALNGVIAGGIAQLIGIPFFGWLSDRLGRKPVLMMGIAGCLVWSFIHFRLIGTLDPTLVMVAVFVGLFLHSATWAPIAAFLSELFDTQVRYSGTAVGFQLAAVAGGAIAPIIATAVAVSMTGGLAISIYVAIIMLIGLVTVGMTRETRDRSFV
ncbi:MAG: MFS transporter [Microbacterium sp.]|nr:MFS transporter [Microbacterium sp.]